MVWTDDPIADAQTYMDEQEEWLQSLPKCECCGEPIQQEKAIYYNDQWCCRDCEPDFFESIRDDFLYGVSL